MIWKKKIGSSIQMNKLTIYFMKSVSSWAVKPFLKCCQKNSPNSQNGSHNSAEEDDWYYCESTQTLFYVFLHVMPKYSSAKQPKIEQRVAFISAKAWALYRVRCYREGWVQEVFHEQHRALSHNPRPYEQTSCEAPSQTQFRQKTLHFQLREPVQGSSNWLQTEIWKLSLRQWAFGGILLDCLPIPAINIVVRLTTHDHIKLSPSPCSNASSEQVVPTKRSLRINIQGSQIMSQY